MKKVGKIGIAVAAGLALLGVGMKDHLVLGTNKQPAPESDPAAVEQWAALLKKGAIDLSFGPGQAARIHAEEIDAIQRAVSAANSYPGPQKNYARTRNACYAVEITALADTDSVVEIDGPNSKSAFALPLYGVVIRDRQPDGTVHSPTLGGYFNDAATFLKAADNLMLESTQGPDSGGMKLHTIGCRSSFAEAQKDVVTLNNIRGEIVKGRVDAFFQAYQERYLIRL